MRIKKLNILTGYIGWSKNFIYLLACTIICIFCVNVIASDIAFYGVNFNEKRPFINDTVNNSLIEYKDSLLVLENDLPVIRKLEIDSRIKITGFTDNMECVGFGCKALSLRRAQLIYNWLLAHGISPSQLLPPKGLGSDDPVGDNKTSIGRARNRRVEFQVIPNLPKQ